MTMNPADDMEHGGDYYRQQMRDLEWVRNAPLPVLRRAVYALCRHCDLATVEAIAADPTARDRVLATARQIATELHSWRATYAERLEQLRGDWSRSDEYRKADGAHRGTKQRITQVNRIIVTCKTAAAASAGTESREELAQKAAIAFAQAVAEHRRSFHPEDATEDDRKLWATLDRIRLPHGYSDTRSAATVLALMDAKANEKAGVASAPINHQENP